jgi:hypothetical protein
MPLVRIPEPFDHPSVDEENRPRWANDADLEARGLNAGTRAVGIYIVMPFAATTKSTFQN